MGAWYRAYCENCGSVEGYVFRKADEDLGILPKCRNCEWHYEWEMVGCEDGSIMIWDVEQQGMSGQ